jgi:hypothetical protein
MWLVHLVRAQTREMWSPVFTSQAARARRLSCAATWKHESLSPLRNAGLFRMTAAPSDFTAE